MYIVIKKCVAMRCYSRRLFWSKMVLRVEILYLITPHNHDRNVRLLAVASLEI